MAGQAPEHPLLGENKAFYTKAEKAFRALFDAARGRNELHFAFSLNPEFRGTRGPGWSTADEARTAFDEYLAFVNEPPSTPLKARVALAFYCHLAEASGYYEIPKNMLRVADGEPFCAWPFQNLVQKHKLTGDMIAPNANKILKDLAGHAANLGFQELAETFRDAFDPDIRNGYAHADYVVWDDGIRLPRRNGGSPRTIPWPEFHARFERGINFFNGLRGVVGEYIGSYNPAKRVRGKSGNAPEGDWTIHADPERGTFTIKGGA